MKFVFHFKIRQLLFHSKAEKSKERLKIKTVIRLLKCDKDENEPFSWANSAQNCEFYESLILSPQKNSNKLNSTFKIL